jgi:hypothetical protein
MQPAHRMFSTQPLLAELIHAACSPDGLDGLMRPARRIASVAPLLTELIHAACSPDGLMRRPAHRMD